jgi:hypothetical protein
LFGVQYLCPHSIFSLHRLMVNIYFHFIIIHFIPKLSLTLTYLSLLCPYFWFYYFNFCAPPHPSSILPICFCIYYWSNHPARALAYALSSFCLGDLLDSLPMVPFCWIVLRSLNPFLDDHLFTYLVISYVRYIWYYWNRSSILNVADIYLWVFTHEFSTLFLFHNKICMQRLS